MRRTITLLAPLAAALSLATAATAGGPTLTVDPPSVHRGHAVTVRGSAPGCAAGNTVFIISRAFARTHEFAGVPALLARVRADGSFRVRAVIPATKAPRRYLLTARCGGGNLGVAARLTVRA